MKTRLSLKSIAPLCIALAFAAVLTPQNAQALTVPKPSASISYPNYIYVTWANVTGASKYYIFRGTTSTFSRASRIATVSTRAARDWTPTLGVKYFYWIAPLSCCSPTYWYNKSKYDWGYRKFTVTYGTVSKGTKVWLKAYANGNCLNTSGAAWKLTWSGVHSWTKYRSCPYLGYFTSRKRGKGYYTLKAGSNVTRTGKGTITWR